MFCGLILRGMWWVKCLAFQKLSQVNNLDTRMCFGVETEVCIVPFAMRMNAIDTNSCPFSFIILNADGVG